MANQYIIKFSNNIYEEPVDGYAELTSTNYNIPVLSVRSCEDKNKAQIILYKIITNNTCNVHFEDEMLECTVTCLGVPNKIKFDKNSSSAYTQFKTQFATLVYSKFETEYYPSGRVFYVGEVLYALDHEPPKRVPNGNGIMYYDLPDYKIKYSGEFENGNFDGAGMFYNKKGNISLKANNISNGIPTQKGKLEVIFKTNKEVVDIDFFTIWEDLDSNDNKSKVKLVMSDNFLDDLAFNVCEYDGMTYDEVVFNNKTQEDKLCEIWSLLKTIQEDRNTHHSELVRISWLTQIYNFLFDFMTFIILAIIIQILNNIDKQLI